MAKEIRALSALEFGEKGFKALGATQSVSITDNQDGFYAIKALAESVIDATSERGDNLENVTVASGDIIVGNFNGVTCDSGTVLVYMR
jgi:hypothetical protein